MKNRHPLIFQNAAFIMGVVGVLGFSVAFTFFAINAYSGQVSADQASDSLSLSDFSSKQDYSAIAISDMPESTDCEKNGTGQVVVVTDFKDFEVSGDKRIEVAVSANSVFTKRGILQTVSEKYSEKIIEAYNKAKASDAKALDKSSFTSGLYFTKVPIESSLQVQLYSPSWGTKSITVSNAATIKDACGTIFVPIIGVSSSEGNMQVCVHSTDKTNNYLPKETFTYPDEQAKIKTFMSSNSGSIVSLGPCQSVEALIEKIKAAASKDTEQSKSNPMTVGSAGNPEISSGTSGAGKQDFINSALEALNKMRAEKGVSPLVLDETATKYANDRLEHITTVTNDCPSHDGALEYYSGIKVTAGENAGFDSESTDGATAMSHYKGSPEHYATIIDPKYTKVGIAVGQGQNKSEGISGQCDLETFIE